MAWDIESVVHEDEWTEEYVRTIIASRPSHTPPKRLDLGSVIASWFSTEPGIAFIATEGGTPDDRIVAESYLREWLRNVGIEQAKYSFFRNDLKKQAAWPDIEQKAKRLIQSGNVQLLRNGAQNIVGHVVGDHGEYQTEISREDPTSQTITQWQCECPWDQYAWQRTRQWKKYEGRPCAHVLATYWASQSAPVDEEVSPGEPQMNLFDPGTAQPAPPGGLTNTPAQPPPPVPQLSIPGVSVPAPEAQPPPEVIPPQPRGVPAPPGVVSVPGARPPSPADPTQYPGGTFSRTAAGLDDWEDTMEGWTDQSPDGWKFVYNTAEGRGIVGGSDDMHVGMEIESGLNYANNHGGTVSPEGLLNVYYWPGKDRQVPLQHQITADRYPPRLIEWLQEKMPVPIRVPQTKQEVLDAADHGQRIAAFENSDMVRLNNDEYGIMEGKSEEHGAGQHKLIPSGSIGEVLGEDPSTGWVDVAFAGPQAKAGPMEPYHVRAWIAPANLTPMPGVRKPGPFIRRR